MKERALKILIDTREQAPYAFTNYNCTTERATLPTGDYSLPGFESLAAIERKSADDLIGCLKGSDRARFERELARLRTYDLAAVVVEASLTDISRGRYRSQMTPHAVLQSVTAFMVRHRVPFLFCGSREGAEYMTYSLLSKYSREIEVRFDRLRKAEGAARRRLTGPS